MLRNALLLLLGVYLSLAAAWILRSGSRQDGADTLLNVACDPTRELWDEMNAAFVAKHLATTGQQVTIRQSHGGSGSQANSVINGNQADIVTLALWSDTDAIRKAGLIDANWENRLPNRSLPYTSTIVFVVRKGNPKSIHDWPDLVKGDTKIITPSPKTSGNGKWSFLAAWGAIITTGGSEAEAEAYMREMYRRVPVLDPSARNATMTFANKKMGDVHLTWENEAHLEVAEAKGELEIITPPRSILAEPHVAWVDRVVKAKNTEVLSRAYLEFLYTEAGQEIIARHHHRPTNAAVLARHKFAKLELFPATVTAPSWDAIHQRFFAEGGVFDRALAK
jgi:sulfate/thiosulfate transport system substrate-binding protein